MPSPLPVGMPPLPRCSNTTIPEGCCPYSCLEGSRQDAVGGKSHTNVVVFARREKLPSPRGMLLPLKRMPPPLLPNPSTVVPTQTPLPSPDSTTLACPTSSPWRSFPCPGEGGASIWEKELVPSMAQVVGCRPSPIPSTEELLPWLEHQQSQCPEPREREQWGKKWYCLFL